MSVDEDTCLRGNVVAVDGGGACGLVWDEERSSRMHAEGLAYDAAQIVKVGKV